jgi:hypothetical protein
VKLKPTNFVNQSGERRTTRAAGKPEQQRVLPGVPLGFYEVVKQLYVVGFPDAHISENH